MKGKVLALILVLLLTGCVAAKPTTMLPPTQSLLTATHVVSLSPTQPPHHTDNLPTRKAITPQPTRMQVTATSIEEPSTATTDASSVSYPTVIHLNKIPAGNLIELLPYFEDHSCVVPCYLGITPGKTSLLDARELIIDYLESFGLPNANPYGKKFTTINLFFDNFDNNVAMIINLFVKGSIVSNIGINTYPYDENHFVLYGEPLYEKQLSDFSLKSILQRYGIPAQIELSGTRDLNWVHQNPLRVTLMFNNAFTPIYFSKYEGNLNKGGKEYLKFCPTNSNITFELGLENGDRVFQMNHSLMLEEATDMTIEEFSDNYSSGNCDVPLIIKRSLIDY